MEVISASYELDDDPILAEVGVHKTYYNEYKIFYTIDDNVKEVFIVRILHMLVDSRAWLYRTFGIPSWQLEISSKKVSLNCRHFTSQIKIMAVQTTKISRKYNEN